MFQLDDVYSKDRQLKLSEMMAPAKMQADQQDIAKNNMALGDAHIERAVKYLGMATPQNWQAIRQNAISEGLGDETTIPLQYNADWVTQTRNAFDTHKLSDGGSTGVLVDRYMKDTGASFPEALQAVQTGFRQNALMKDGKLSAIMGAGDAKAEIAGAEAKGKKIGELQGEAVGAQDKKATNATNILPIIDEAATLIPKSTGSGIGAMVDWAAGVIGTSNEGSEAIDKLRVLSSALVSNVPRMEGPQSDKDVALYRQAAGDIADPTKPRPNRLAALQTVKELQQKYAQQGTPQGSAATPPSGGGPARKVYNPATGRLE